MNYYNDNDPQICAWLRALIEDGLIPQGQVDERSITDVRPADLRGFAQCHFFAGIGGWSLALQLAGWPEEREVWTGSCPCQPFSVTGKAGGVGDRRHLWPAFRGLIAECHPAIVFGEQVASKAGRLWLAGVRLDLEAMGYAVGGADLCAASMATPHVRQRLYWVGNAKSYQRKISIFARQKDSEFGGNGQSNFWADAVGHPCLGGKTKRISPQPEVFPLAPRLPGRVGLLRGAGNGIVPPLAAEFIKAAIETMNP